MNYLIIYLNDQILIVVQLQPLCDVLLLLGGVVQLLLLARQVLPVQIRPDRRLLSNRETPEARRHRVHHL